MLRPPFTGASIQCFAKGEHLLLTFRHRAGVRPYTSSFDLAESCVFDKQSPGPFHCGPHCCGRPFSRSYGPILPSSLAMNLSSTLEFSSQLPVSVYGTGCHHSLFLEVDPLDYHAGRSFCVLSPCYHWIQRTIPSVRTNFSPPSAFSVGQVAEY